MPTETITAEGYGIDATLTPTELRVHGRNKMARIALRGEEHAAGDVVLPLEQIASVDHQRPKMGGMVNGHVIVRTVDEKKYELHYRAKKHADFADFADRLVEAVSR